MRKFLILLCFTALILTGCGLARSGKIFAPHPARASTADQPPQPTGLAATHRSGQTFLTWTERAGLAGEIYRVYRHDQSITAGNLSQATLLYEVPEGSARFFANRYNVDYSGTWQARYLERFVIQDNGAQLAAGTGLLVWTLAADDFGGSSSGNGYYAVTTVDGGEENTADFSAGNTTGPMAEAVDDPLPVEINANVGDRGQVFIQYMPLRAWNSTFHAPNQTNQYYGLNDADPVVANAIQYAYDYVVYEPGTTQCGPIIPDEVPVMLILHGWDGNTYAPPSEDPDPWEGWCAYKIYPVDVTETWWFGFARDHDYRRGGYPTAGNLIVNYTEQRVLRMVFDLIRDPTGPEVDTNRIYVYGHSMGASGTLAMALRYPNLFAAAYASEPVTNYRTSGDGGGKDWRSDLTPKWGSPEDSLPVLIGGSGNWADHLQPFNNTGVWDWQNHQENLQTRQGDEMVPFGVGHGMNDTVIEWSTQGQPAYAVFNASRRAWGGAVTNAEHGWLSFQGMPPSLGPDDAQVPFSGLQVVREETVPGLSNASNDLDIPPNATGGYNHTLLWSSSWNPWDGAPIDTPGRWQISLCSIDSDPWVNDCGSGTSQTVDVTPRRTQSFVVVPGASYAWENRRVNDDALISSGTVAADTDGVVTVTDFAVSPQGNRLRLEPVDGPPLDVFNFLPVVLKNLAATPAPTSTPTPTPTASATLSASPTPTPTPTPSDGAAPRPWPDTTIGIHVFNDQLAPWMSAAQWQFAATRYAGTQKMLRSDADQLRAINPNFLILHYRLGHGLGYRAIQNGCQPTGDWLELIEGDVWVQEWPGDGSVQENWFYHWPEVSASWVLNCDWGWYLAELDDAAWRTYWHGEVLRQVQANDNDGVFMDSLSVPNYLGYDRYDPTLPEVDNAFETAWATRIENWLTWLQSQVLGDYYLVPNVGSWTTSRETTDYSAADGVMIEGFALEADESPYNLEDWRMQMNRALGLISQGRAILAQSYATGDQERMFTLGSYLLIKGNRTFINIDLDLEPEWWPEYDIPIGAPIESAGTDVGNLYDAVNQVFRRDFGNSFVLVNPTSPWDGTALTTTVDLGGTFYLAQPSGGGAVPGDGIPTGTVTYQAVTQVTLPPYTTMVLLNESP